MINKIIDGISIQLNKSFGKKCEIYTENVKQGLKEPCFFVSLISPTSRHMIGRRYQRNNMFCIQYFPSSNEPKLECNRVLESLYTLLEYIEVDGNKTKGIKMHGEIADDVLSFFVNYDMFVYKSESKPNFMEELTEVKINMKG